MCVVFLWWQAQLPMCVYVCCVWLRKPVTWPDALSHEGREAAILPGVGGLGGPLANGILPFLGCNVKFPAHTGNTRIWWFLAIQ